MDEYSATYSGLYPSATYSGLYPYSGPDTARIPYSDNPWVPCVVYLQFSFWLSESRFLREKRPSSRREWEG